jgi:hypothetical protein
LLTCQTTPKTQVCYSIKDKRDSPEDKDSQAIGVLTERGFGNPKDTFGFMNLGPDEILMRGAEQFIEQKFDQRLGEIKCDNGRCESCLDEKETRSCCGCACMQCRWGDAGDFDPCPDCNLEADSTGDWGGDDVLLKRANIITPVHKPVKILGRKIKSPDPAFRYPPFPNDRSKVWEGIDGGIYDEISRYYGNNSANCNDWRIAQHAKRDRLHVGNGIFRQAPYQSKINLADCNASQNTC